VISATAQAFATGHHPSNGQWRERVVLLPTRIISAWTVPGMVPIRTDCALTAGSNTRHDRTVAER
jgi:hypothetical protein